MASMYPQSPNPANSRAAYADEVAENRHRSGARVINAPAFQAGGPSPNLLLADALKGNEVINTQGEHLGEIKGIMLDVGSGRIVYAVLAFGGFFGLGNKLFAVPFSAFQIDISNNLLVLDESRDRLKNAPGFDQDHWPSLADERWTSEVDAFYGLPKRNR
ncbi:hypothetical protein IGB42_02291 [Andreprevotia sp. IGB-42]|uniref:PRC-barrel domain-containing protein n=1 Tax=Andreprevotia sp. IGB-42 TaxID=2497473 RepID=UPI00157ED24C|nr:PRC-barrel domain-containing protein [Andreprevotia sp. IGB-42]KAF0813362.1 hypothetical protein IGB42_02291 [Andreprevotia sp. IGB-42]